MGSVDVNSPISLIALAAYSSLGKTARPSYALNEIDNSGSYQPRCLVFDRLRRSKPSAIVAIGHTKNCLWLTRNNVTDYENCR